jgi:hypothetical protein
VNASNLTQEQTGMLATLTLAYPIGLIYEDPASMQVADALVQAGHVTPVDQVAGGYRLPGHRGPVARRVRSPARPQPNRRS